MYIIPNIFINNIMRNNSAIKDFIILQLSINDKSKHIYIEFTKKYNS